MRLTDQQLSEYERDGFLLLPGYFSADEVALLRSELPTVFGIDSPALIREAGSGVVRGVHGVHETNPVFGALVRQARLVEPARQLLDDEVYVHQFKINAKLALIGDVWEWHQDFRFWHSEDGMPEPRALTFGLFLDEVDEFNGPLMLVPGSHHGELAEVTRQPGAEGWASTLTSSLKYQVGAETLARTIGDGTIVAPKGPAGSVLLFHSKILHGSAPNMSPRNRTIVLTTYNSVSNALADVPEPRPEFLASRRPVPLTPADALAPV
ncbi:phytanoyl-CoA dioxygenase family protein [Micromonospora sp. NBS 11-29]|uniref:phytanoyl-CoA dioxygenase family protein n=1 Tax=Micromonospora sp. NBS 11-29 TaxID=1960879 RepID=UPI0015938E5C|nr:phytanoyl-CoA dioxygenase family protein [Micromonospora sp. NBS 11-29]